MLAWFNQLIRSALQSLRAVQDQAAEKEMIPQKQTIMEPVRQPMEKELAEAARDVETNQKKSLALLKHSDLSQFAIKGSEDDWASALKDSSHNIVSVKGKEKKRKLLDKIKDEDDRERRKKKKFKKHDGGHKKKKLE